MSKNAFFRSHRLLKSSDFNRLREGSKVLKYHNIKAIIKKNGHSGDCSRLGLVASRKFGNAVKRNRFKRLAREAFRVSSLKASHGVDLILIAPASKTGSELLEMKKVFEKIEGWVAQNW